jgi:hypothetical protein
MQNAPTITYAELSMPRGWLILGLALAAWLAVIAAWQGISLLVSAFAG